MSSVASDSWWRCLIALRLKRVLIFSSVAGLWNSCIMSRGRTTACRSPSLPSCKCWMRCAPTKPARVPPSASTAGQNLLPAPPSEKHWFWDISVLPHLRCAVIAALAVVEPECCVSSIIRGTSWQNRWGFALPVSHTWSIDCSAPMLALCFSWLPQISTSMT